MSQILKRNKRTVAISSFSNGVQSDRPCFQKCSRFKTIA